MRHTVSSSDTPTRDIPPGIAAFFCTLLFAFFALLPAAPAQAVEIANPGEPLHRIGITPTGNLYAYHMQFTHQLYYGSNTTSAAGWMVHDADDGKLHGPAVVSFGGNMTSTTDYTAWIAGSQTGPTGSGTIADPYTITSTMSTTTGLTATVTVTYVLGDEHYGTSLKLTDSSGSARTLRAFLGADLYYGNSDTGEGFYDPVTGAIGGISHNVTPPFTGWIIPSPPADHYTVNAYSDVWRQIGARQLDNAKRPLSSPGAYYDYAAALQWNITLPANGTVEVSGTQLFSDRLQLMPGTLPNGTVGVPYSQAFTPSNGISPHTLAIVAGNPPPGLTFDPATNTLSGTPTMNGTYTFTINVTDSKPGTQLTRDFAYTLIVGDALQLAPGTLSNGTVGVPYSQAFTPSNGIAPYTLGIVGTLPPGLVFDLTTNTLSGTPATAGSYTFAISVTDSTPGTALTRNFNYTLLIVQALNAAPTAVPTGSAAGLALLALLLGSIAFGAKRRRV